jgi:sulfate adenylyltransferase
MTTEETLINNCLLTASEIQHYKQQLHSFASWSLTNRQLCDLELILNGGFSPLTGFMSEQQYHSVLANRCLPNGQLWPMPITLDVTQHFADTIAPGATIALLDKENSPLALLCIESIWQPNKQQEAFAVFGSDDFAHPGVHYLFNQSGDVYLGGKLLGLALPDYYDFPHLRHTPQQLRHWFKQQGWQRIVGFQTRNPMHRAHLALTTYAMQQTHAKLLLHPTVGMTKPGDLDHYSRVRCYEKLVARYPVGSVHLSLLPLAMRMAGPVEALWHALIRKNYGCTHFIVGRDHAGPGKNSQGQDFYAPYAAQQLLTQYAAQLGIEIVLSEELGFVKERNTYLPRSQVKANETVLTVSGTQLREYLKQGITIPAWFSYPEIVEELQHIYKPRLEQGFTLFFTGLSGAGKSTIANALLTCLLAKRRRVTLLDGDVIRQHLCPELGFSKRDRDLNVKRIGYVASEITKHGGVALCAQIAPYTASRSAVRQLIEPLGDFIEIYVATSLAVCEQRDKKGLYAQARAGKIQHFTGISDPYEAPEQPEIYVDTAITSIPHAVQLILAYLQHAGLVE